MTPEQQRIAIAEYCGWKDETYNFSAWFKYDKDNFEPIAESSSPPDYLNDLNAMHEAEKVLNKELFEVYYTNLCTSSNCLTLGVRAFTSATSQQRAEAFLRTIGKWKD